MMIRNQVNLKACRSTLADVSDMEVDGPEHADTEVAMTRRNMNRESNVPLANLED